MILSPQRMRFGAGNGTRTRDIQLGKLTLYQLSYARLRGADSNIDKDTRQELQSVRDSWVSNAGTWFALREGDEYTTLLNVSRVYTR